MKWFKHHSNSHRDKTLRGVFRKYGLEGEARFWRLIELMAERFQNDEVQFDFDLETIRESLRFRSVNDCRPFLDLLTTLSRMKVEYSGNNCRIIYHKILEIKDNHSRNLQVTDKQLTSNLLLEENKNKNKNKNKKQDADDEFEKGLESVYKSYSFTEGYPRNIFEEFALEAYPIYLASNKPDKQWLNFLTYYIKNNKPKIQERMRQKNYDDLDFAEIHRSVFASEDN